MRNLWRKSNKFFREKYAKPILIGLLIILIVPIIVSILMENSLMDIGTQKAESWMSFWGGYLGAFVGLLAVLYATNKQIDSSKELMRIQLNEQTKQIEISAEIHDNLERKRVYINTILEKNLEFQQSVRELQDIYEKNSQKAEELLETVRFLNDLFANLEHLKKTGFLDSKVRNCERNIISKKSEYDQLKKSLELFSRDLQHAINKVKSGKIFIDLIHDEDMLYIEHLNQLLMSVDRFSNTMKILSEYYFHGTKTKEKLISRGFSKEKKQTNRFFEEIYFYSGSHISFILSQIIKD